MSGHMGDFDKERDDPKQGCHKTLPKKAQFLSSLNSGNPDLAIEDQS